MNTFQLWAWKPWHSGVCVGVVLQEMRLHPSSYPASLTVILLQLLAGGFPFLAAVSPLRSWGRQK